MKVHMALPVADILATQRFYEALFQSPPSKVKHDYVKFEPAHLALNISFYQDASAVDTRRHLGLQLETTAEVSEHYARLQAEGLVHKDRDTSVCCYAAQDKFWVKDPNGYEWELYARLYDTEEKLAPKKGAVGCCESSAASAGCCA